MLQGRKQKTTRSEIFGKFGNGCHQDLSEAELMYWFLIIVKVTQREMMWTSHVPFILDNPFSMVVLYILKPGQSESCEVEN